MRDFLLLCALITVISLMGECQDSDATNKAEVKLRLQLLKGER